MGYFYATTCKRGSWKFKKVIDAEDKCPLKTSTDCCWGTVTAVEFLCPMTVNAPVIIGVDTAFVKDDVVNGYYLAADFELKPCALGCSACTKDKVCTACLGDFKVDADKKCVCTADGMFLEDENTCSKMIENCKTQTKKDICDTCADDYETPKAADKTEKETDVSKC